MPHLVGGVAVRLRSARLRMWGGYRFTGRDKVKIQALAFGRCLSPKIASIEKKRTSNDIASLWFHGLMQCDSRAQSGGSAYVYKAEVQLSSVSSQALSTLALSSEIIELCTRLVASRRSRFIWFYILESHTGHRCANRLCADGISHTVPRSTVVT